MFIPMIRPENGVFIPIQNGVFIPGKVSPAVENMRALVDAAAGN